MRKIKPLILLIGIIFISSISFAQEVTSDFSYYPKIEYNAQIVASSAYGNNNTFEKIVIDGFDSKIPFYSIKPKNNKEDRFIILLHGITGSKDDWIKPELNWHKITDSLLTLGYTVIIPDAKYHGERSYEANFTSPVTFFASQDVEKVYNLISTTVKDTRILMDYIQYNTVGKPTNFDVIGYSMGGIVSILLNSTDNRLKSVVACVPPFDGYKACQRIGMSDENAKTLDVISAKSYAQLQKAPITLLMGTKDGWYTKKEAQDFFDTINIKDKTQKFYESGHMLPDEFVADAIKNISKE